MELKTRSMGYWKIGDRRWKMRKKADGVFKYTCVLLGLNVSGLRDGETNKLVRQSTAFKMTWELSGMNESKELTVYE